MNCDLITTWIFLGSKPETAEDLDRLRGLGITHIIDCRAEADDIALLANARDFTYLNNGVPDWTPEAAVGKQPLPLSFFATALGFWEKSGPFHAKFYIHCSMGMNRSVTLTYFFLRVLGLTTGDAIELLNQRRALTMWFDFFDAPWRKDAEQALNNVLAPTVSWLRKPDWGQKNNELLRQILAIVEKIEANLTDIRTLGITIDKPIKQ